MFLSPGSSLPGGQASRRFGFPSGTTMMFIQPAAPLGWRRVTTNDDALLRIVGSAAPSTGGSNGFVAAFNSQTQTGSQSISSATTAANNTGTGTSGSHTLTTGELPTLTLTFHYNSGNSNSGTPYPSANDSNAPCHFGVMNSATNASSNNTVVTDGNGGGSHTHSVPALSIPSLAVNTFTVGPLSLTTGIKYVDSLVAKKN